MSTVKRGAVFSDLAHISARNGNPEVNCRQETIGHVQSFSLIMLHGTAAWFIVRTDDSWQGKPICYQGPMQRVVIDTMSS